VRANIYFDLRVAASKSSGSAHAGQPGNASGGPTIFAMARAFHVLHGITRAAGLVHALAFPEMRAGERHYAGSLIRVFADDRDTLESIADKMEASPFVRDYAAIGRVRAVPAGLSGGFVEYRRFRTPGRSSRLQESRLKRLKEGDQLPFFQVASASTGNRFSVRVQPIARNTAIADDFQPDSYGLSGCERAFALPMIPL
jgi:hypothetical protein